MELPAIVLLIVLDLTQTELATAMAEIVCTAFFLAMRPCEYTKMSTTAESKKTKIITPGNIRFYRNNRILRHDQDKDNAEWVNITFKYQKNNDQNESVGMYI